MEYGIIRGLCWWRIIAAVWATAIIFESRDKLYYPTYAVMACALLIVVAIVMQSISRREPSFLLRQGVIFSELALCIGITCLGGYIYERAAVTTTLAFAGQFVLAGVLMAGVAYGMWGGIIAGLVMGIARYFALVINHSRILEHGQILSLLSTTFTFVLAGAFTGGVVGLLRKTGGELSEARARDSIARTLHDGVLQSLVIIQRRSKEKEIIDIASRQEQDLRSFLFTHHSELGDPVVALHNAIEDVVTEYLRNNSVPVSIVIAPDMEPLSRAATKAITGACRECLSNTSKHAEASSVSIYAEPDGDVCIVSVRDDGKGFDEVAVLQAENKSPEKHGLRSSIVARIEEIGGTVTIRSSPESGTEIEMKVPFQSAKKNAAS